VDTIPFNTNKGKVNLNIWDCAGKELLRGAQSTYLEGKDAFIIMFDATSNTSIANVEGWLSTIRSVNPNTIVTIVGNKVDSETNSDFYYNPEEFKYAYYSVSAKMNTNCEKPIVHIIRAYYGDKQIHYTGVKKVKKGPKRSKTLSKRIAKARNKLFR